MIPLQDATTWVGGPGWEFYQVGWNTFLNKCGYVIYHFNAHFSLYAFASDVLLAVYFIFILDYGNDVRQKANSSDFLTQVQNGLKGPETTHNMSNTHLAQELLMDVQCSGGSRSTAKECLEDEKCNGQPLEADNDN